MCVPMCALPSDRELHTGSFDKDAGPHRLFLWDLCKL